MAVDISILKTEMNKRTPQNSSLLGKYVMESLTECIEIALIKDEPTTYIDAIKKGDVVITTNSNKPRPAVVIKVNENDVLLLSMTTANNYQSTNIPYESRFFRNGYFGYTISKMDIEQAKKTFAGVLDNPVQLNKAINHVKKYYSSKL